MNNPLPSYQTSSRSPSTGGLKVIRRVCAVLLTLLLFGVAFSAEAVTVKVDSTRTWLGFCNVTGLSGYANYQFGSPWGLQDLRAEFVKTNSNPSGWPVNDIGVQRVNINTYNTNDIYWNNPDGTANKLIEANWYTELGTNYGGQTVTFEGTVISNSIPLAALSGLPTATPAAWHVVAFVKEFTAANPPGFVDIVTTTNLSPGAFTVSNPIAVGNVAQVGFYTFGPNTAPGSADAAAGLAVVVEDSDPAIITQPADVTVNTSETIDLSAEAVGSTALSYQWQKDGTDVTNGGTITGADTANLTISSAELTNSGDYTVIVSNTSGSTTSQVAVVTVQDIFISDQPSDLRVEAGSTVVFGVTASSASTLGYQWKYASGGTTNNLSDGADISGTTTDTLTLSNVQTNQSGTYICTITTIPGGASADVSANLNVKTPADYSNFLENPGFENVDETPWVRFESTDPSFGQFADSSATYPLSADNVTIYEGNYVSFTIPSGTYSGIYQDVAAEPGQIFKAEMSFWNPSQFPIPGPSPYGSTNECYLEVLFWDGTPYVTAFEPIQQYVTDFMDYNTPQDVWFTLQATNAGSYGYNPPSADAEYLVAPEGTVLVRFQLTIHDIANSVGNGSLYYDSAKLMLKIPVDLTITAQGSDVKLSWKTQGDTSYQVQYKDDIAGDWTNGEVVAGDGSVITRTYSNVGQRYYRVLTL